MKCSKRLRQDLNYSSTDGFLSSAMTGAGETFFPAFALALGASQCASGMITVLPFLIGSCLQLLAPRALVYVGSYRRWIAGLAFLQALCFLPLLVLAHGGGCPQWVLFTFVTLYWACGLSGVPAWNSWLAHLVPPSLRPRYFAKRTRLGQIGLLSGLVTGGFLLQSTRGTGHEMQAFASLFIVSCLFRMASAVCLWRQTEPEGVLRMHRRFPLRDAIDRVMTRQSAHGKLFLFILVFTFGTYLCSSFFNAYMLKKLELRYVPYIILISATYIAKMISLSLFSRYARHMDSLKLMRWGMLGAALSPMLWIVSGNFAYLLVLQILGGACWGIYELGLMLTLFGCVKDEERTTLMSVFNFGTAAMMLLGTAVGGQLLSFFGESLNAYFLIFALSTGGRLMALVWLDRAAFAIRGGRLWRPTTTILVDSIDLPRRRLRVVNGWIRSRGWSSR